MQLTLRVSIASIFILACLLNSFSCKESDPDIMEEIKEVVPKVSIGDVLLKETNVEQTITVEVSLDQASDKDVMVSYTTKDQSAMRGLDYQYQAESLVFAAGQILQEITLRLVGDDQEEGRETFVVELSDPINAELNKSLGIITIVNDDNETTLAADGYVVPETYEGYELRWSDEFNGETIDEEKWSFELGDGCPDLCGFGNSELQNYTNEEKNISQKNGKLIIGIHEEAINGRNYTSARIKTQDKYEFNFGRIDIRAKLPEGQGIWPAVWLLGANIDEVNWPACGEIDIVEVLGQEPAVAHGTIHYGTVFPDNKMATSSYVLDKSTFANEFHVFSILWEFDAIRWYVDDILFHEVTRSTTQSYNYPFNNKFFLLVNAAVGGNWPGSPDATTQFPQTMELDFIRVHKLVRP